MTAGPTTSADSTQLPEPVRPLVGFVRYLRGHDFAIAPEQVASFMSAVRLLGPRRPDQIRLAGHATLAPPAERRGTFDALYQSYFFGEANLPIEPKAQSGDERTRRDGSGTYDPPAVVKANKSGQVASDVALSSVRRFGSGVDDDLALRRFAREMGRRLPTRRRMRYMRVKRGDRLDLRAAMRDIVRHDGDIHHLDTTAQPKTPRPIVLIIDISGSMKAHTEDHLRFAHALTCSAVPVETYLIGARLTPLTAILKQRLLATVLADASAYTDDWDGGTRIGTALGQLLSASCQVNQLRGAVVFVLSDGLERGDHREMTAACKRIAALAHRFVWLTPLALDPDFQPRTAALQTILPLLDAIGPSGDLGALCHACLNVDTLRPRNATSHEVRL